MTEDTQLESALDALRIYKGKTIAVGLSGGVDSSTVLALLTKAGAHTIGISMKIYNPDAGTVPPGIDACYGPGEAEDFALCERICTALGVPYHVID
ncbi:MAG TPA: asparagine synthase-related protein, partial [Spirochaetia bacterium]|nr:asparagine synthase-related protein [Spirochaetia bacterium]